MNAYSEKEGEATSASIDPVVVVVDALHSPITAGEAQVEETLVVAAAAALVSEPHEEPAQSNAAASGTTTTTASGTNEHPVIHIADVLAVQVDAPETIPVVAPADLLPGYRLRVNAGPGQGSVLVEIPSTGAQQGQLVQAIIVMDEEGYPQSTRQSARTSTTSAATPTSTRLRNSMDHHVPIGAWRDGMFTCCKKHWGLWHPVFWLGCLAPPILLGQILTRLDLNACVEPHRTGMNNRRIFCFCSAFWVLIIVFVVSLTVGVVFDVLVDLFDEQTEDDEEEETAGSAPGLVIALWMSRFGISVFVYVFMFIVAVRTRSYVRQRYKIPSRCCGHCEDACCILWCSPCSLCQMRRHLNDFDTTPAKCCTQTGLSREPPV